MAPDTNHLLTRIGQIAVPVRDLDRAIDFYRNRLGLPFLFQAGSLAFFNCGGVRLMLTLPETSLDEHPSSVVYYAVTDIHTAYEELVARGVRFEDQPHCIAEMESYDLWMAFFQDSESNQMGIMTEVSRAS